MKTNWNIGKNTIHNYLMIIIYIRYMIKWVQISNKVHKMFYTISWFLRHKNHGVKKNALYTKQLGQKPSHSLTMCHIPPHGERFNELYLQ